MTTNNAINLSDTGVVSYDGAGNFTGSVLTQYTTLAGNAANAIFGVDPGSAGMVLTSNGNVAFPTYQNLPGTTASQYATYLVNPTPGLGTHTTIAAALAVAVSGDTIWIYEGTYTEDLTMVNGVIMSAYQDSVTIIGRVDCTAISCRFIGITFQTNGDYAFTLTGTGPAVDMTNCSINATNNTGILNTSTGGSFQMTNCGGNVLTTGIAFFDASGATGGVMFFFRCRLGNAGNSTVTNDYNCSIAFYYCVMGLPLVSGASDTVMYYTYNDTSNVNLPVLEDHGTGAVSINLCFLNSGTATCVISDTGGSGQLTGSFIASLNAVVIDAPSTLVYYNNFRANSTNGSVNCAQAGVQGMLGGTTPSAGCIGEQIRSFVPGGSSVSLPASTSTNITSISLTSGTWDVSSILSFTATVAATQIGGGISLVSNTLPTDGDAATYTGSTFTTSPTATVVPSYRIVTTTTTTVYLVGFAAFAVGTAAAYGRISATRVG